MTLSIAGFTLQGLGKIPKRAEKSYQYLLLRLLLGTVTITRGNATTKQATDFSSLPATPQSKTPAAAIKDFLTTFNVGGNVERFVKVTTADNRNFYQEILFEFLNFHLQTAQGRNTGAFVFLYRVLERVSYSVPLLYASTSTDYIGTFNDLKAILNPTTKGELGLFKKFLNQGKFIDEIKLQVPQKIIFSSPSGYGLSHYNLTCKKFEKLFISNDHSRLEVEIKFADILDLLIQIRNRFFHSLTGDDKDNISATEMSDSDEYFLKVNSVISSFLSIIVLHTIAYKYQIQ